MLKRPETIERPLPDEWDGLEDPTQGWVRPGRGSRHGSGDGVGVRPDVLAVALVALLVAAVCSVGL